MILKVQEKHQKEIENYKENNFDFNGYNDQTNSIDNFLKNITISPTNKTPSFSNEKKIIFYLYGYPFNFDELSSPGSKLFNFWKKVKHKYHVSNMLYWLNNLDLNTQKRLYVWRKKRLAIIDKKIARIKSIKPKTNNNIENNKSKNKNDLKNSGD